MKVKGLKTWQTSVYPWELCGTPEVRAGRSIDMDDDSSTRRHELGTTPTDECGEADNAVANCPLAKNAEQRCLGEEKTCVSNRPRVEPGMLNDQVGQLWANTDDRVESRPEPVKPALEGLQDPDLEDGGANGAGRVDGGRTGDAPGDDTGIRALNSYTVG